MSEDEIRHQQRKHWNEVALLLGLPIEQEPEESEPQEPEPQEPESPPEEEPAFDGGSMEEAVFADVEGMAENRNERFNEVPGEEAEVEVASFAEEVVEPEELESSSEESASLEEEPRRGRRRRGRRGRKSSPRREKDRPEDSSEEGSESIAGDHFESPESVTSEIIGTGEEEDESSPEQEPDPEKKRRGRSRRRGRRKKERGKVDSNEIVEAAGEENEEEMVYFPEGEEEDLDRRSADSEVFSEADEEMREEEDFDIMDDEPDMFKDWNVPSWQELIASLYRPDR